MAISNRLRLTGSYLFVLLVPFLLVAFCTSKASAQSEVCHVIDYESYPDGTAIEPGDYLQFAFTGWGIEGIIGSDPADGLLPIAFDSDNPTCGDAYLGPTGYGNVMVIQEKLSDCRPNAIETDHRLAHLFAEPVRITHIIMYGTENDFVNTLENPDGEPLVITTPSQGVNNLTWIDVPWWYQVRTLTSEAGGTFAIKELGYCAQSPTSISLSSFSTKEDYPELAEIIGISGLVGMGLFFVYLLLQGKRNDNRNN